MSDIQAVKGDTEVFDVLCTRYNPVTKVNDPVIPVKAWFTAKRTNYDTDQQAVISNDSAANPDDVIITGNNVRVIINGDDTKNFPDRWLKYDVQIREADNSITTVQRGNIELLEDSTKTTT